MNGDTKNGQFFQTMKMLYKQCRKLVTLKLYLENEIDFGDSNRFKKLELGVVDVLNSGEESEMKKVVRSVLRVSIKSAEYYLNRKGEMYVKVNHN